MKNKKPSRTVTARRKRQIRRAQPVHKRFLLHPATIFFLLLIGVFLACMTFKAFAEDFAVTARIPAALPLSPAIITSPTDGQHFSTIPITVSGTCPDNSYVKIYRDNVFSGSVLCATDDTFSLQIGLVSGTNQLQARVFNVTDDEGPTSSPITVYYDQPQPPSTTTTNNISSTPAPVSTTPSSGSGSSSNSTGPPPFDLSSNFFYKGYLVNQTVRWSLQINGGSSPYALSIDWGDGNTTLVSQEKDGTVNITHKYSKAGGYLHQYIIKVKGVDAQGNQAFIQIFVIINPSKNPYITTGGSISSSGSLFSLLDSAKRWLVIVWPAYLMTILMACSFWLGERQEFRLLKGGARKWKKI